MTSSNDWPQGGGLYKRWIAHGQQDSDFSTAAERHKKAMTSGISNLQEMTFT